jgi:sugar lactone lactonase YvrE
MNKTLSIVFASLLIATVICQPTFAQQSQSLFNGKDLDGWVQRGGKAKYTVEDGMIVGTTVPGTPNSFLCTEKNYDNFVLELEFQVDTELNSGVQVRSESKPEYQNGRVHGYQVEIDASERAWTAGIYDEGRRGWLKNLVANNPARYAYKQNQWNKFTIIANGNSIRTFLNGVPAADLKDDMTPTGFIALQVHGVGNRKDPLVVRWRNIHLRAVNENDTTATVDPSTEIESVVPPGARLEVIADNLQFAEGPATGPDGRLYFTDIPNNRIHVFDPQTKKVEVFRENTGGTNGLHWTANDALICCEGGNRKVTWQWADGQKTEIASEFEGKKLNSPNDVTLDALGGMYFTDPRYGDRSNMAMEIEGVYYLDRGRKISRVIDDLKQPNGIVLSGDFKKLYVADAGGGKIFRYNVQGPGKLGNKQEFAAIGSDGMTIDNVGNVYCTWQSAVQVFSPQGENIKTILTPERPSNVTFGGPENKTLFITARSKVYAIQMNTHGVQAFANPQ